MSYEIAVSLGLGIISFCFIFLATTIKEKHWVLQIFFLSIGLISIVTQADIVGKIAVTDTAIADNIYQLYTLYLWSTIFVIAYFMIGLFIDVITDLSKRKNMM